MAVELDQTAKAFLDRLMRHSARDIWQGRDVEIWLSPDKAPRGDTPRAIVHIGAERVGQLDAAATEHFLPVMEAAAERDEDLSMRARLTRIPGEMPYLLELASPDVGDG